MLNRTIATFVAPILLAGCSLLCIENCPTADPPLDLLSEADTVTVHITESVPTSATDPRPGKKVIQKSGYTKDSALISFIIGEFGLYSGKWTSGYTSRMSNDSVVRIAHVDKIILSFWFRNLDHDGTAARGVRAVSAEWEANGERQSAIVILNADRARDVYKLFNSITTHVDSVQYSVPKF